MEVKLFGPAKREKFSDPFDCEFLRSDQDLTHAGMSLRKMNYMVLIFLVKWSLLIIVDGPYSEEHRN